MEKFLIIIMLGLIVFSSICCYIVYKQYRKDKLEEERLKDEELGITRLGGYH